MGLILHPAAAPFHAFKQICVAHPVCRLYSHHISERVQEASSSMCAGSHSTPSSLPFVNRVCVESVTFRCVNVKLC